MKRLLLLLFFIPFISLAQVPQGVGYQGVATDANGIELVNDSISFRASVLSGSANGTIEWEETHATSTDTFGLFTLTIGQGTNTTNGAQTSFADISWGTNTHFLKIEMDVAGGTNYSFMGTNQMMSVPYALYAENANINYDSISNLLSNDSTFITNVGGGMGGGGCDFRFPEGLDGVPITIGISSSQSYTVPSGQRFYILQKNDAFVLYKNGNQISNSQSYEFTQPLIINENDVITSGSGINIKHVSGILITNPDSNVQPITIEISSSQSYIVPSGQRLYLLNKGTGFGVYKNGNEVADGVSYFSIPIIFNENDIVNTEDIPSVYASGYLVDENYFAGCGGGGSSSSGSAVDSAMVANMIAGAGGGCDFNYPEGVNGEGISTDVSQSNLYSVPTGKRLYLLTWQESAPVISGLSDYSSINGSSPLILNSGQSIYPANANTTSRMNGLLVPESNNLQGISTDVSQSNPYTVPLNKRLYLLSWAGSSPIINGLSDFISLGGGKPLILNSGQSVSPEDANTTSRMNGYLVDENYFAGCGGGGSSSATSSLDSTTIANMIAGAGGGCNFLYPEGYDGEGISSDVSLGNLYTVPAGKRLYLLSYSNGSPMISGLQNPIWAPTSKPVILNAGESLSLSPSSTSPSTMNGILVDENPDVQAVSSDVSSGNPYTVPIGKRLYLLAWYPGTPTISGNTGTTTIPNGNPIILNGGESLSSSSPSTMNGYLVDENYFANCGGGSSSSNTGLDSATVSTMIANALTQQNSKDYDFIEANDSLYIPSGVFSIFIEVWGAGGGGVPWWQGCQLSGSGGGGGYVSASMQVQQNDLLVFEIGNQGGYGTTNNSHGQSTKIYLNGTLIIEAEGGYGAACGSAGSGGSGTIYNYNIINNEHIFSGSGGTICNQCNAEPGYSFNGILYNNNLNYGMGNCSGCGSNSKKGFVFIKY